MNRPFASLSLDLDNQWSYMKTHGDAGWESFPGYLDVAVPRILSCLDGLGLRVTFFIVGKDASMDENAEVLRSIAEAGHEVANHSYWHEPWFHLYDRDQTEREMEQAEDAIEAATGIRPRGWRGPGFSFSPVLLEALAARNYLYDASTFPSILGPAARLYYLATSGMSAAEKAKRGQLCGAHHSSCLQ